MAGESEWDDGAQTLAAAAALTELGWVFWESSRSRDPVALGWAWAGALHVSAPGGPVSVLSEMLAQCSLACVL